MARRDPLVCVVVASTGSLLPRNKAITWKGTCVVHDDRGTLVWFYRELPDALYGTESTMAGRYDDDLVRTPTGWRISHRRLVATWADGNPRVVRGG
ncbi:MAG: hypothetical protein F2873_11935 [Actinobacteria bacterium]|nr:hypothetical protein [Actinomycetota bacterium]